MSEVIRLLLRKNKTNGQINASIPIKKIPLAIRKKMKFLDIKSEDLKW